MAAKSTQSHHLLFHPTRNEMYTNIDRLVISVNPFQNLPIYASDYIDLYAKAADTYALWVEL